jgi:hypothetical protein
MPDDARSALVFGARNLGKAILETLSGPRARTPRSTACPRWAASRSAPT